MFDIQSIQASSANPTFTSILLSVVLALVLSSLVVITYDFTTKSIERNHNYLQALALISILATMVMQAVGDSLARGLGMLGALAIIRFRTTLTDPRNMTFMFASLAIGICCGSFGFTIATVGTVIFCSVAFILKFSSFGKFESLVGDLQIVSNNNRDIQKRIEQIIGPFTSTVLITNYRIRNISIPTEEMIDPYGKKRVINSESLSVKEFAFDIKMKSGKDEAEMLELLSNEEEVREVKLRFTRKEIRL